MTKLLVNIDVDDLDKGIRFSVRAVSASWRGRPEPFLTIQVFR
jgi:hypothetical protein